MTRSAPKNIIPILALIFFFSLSLIFLTWIPDDAYISYCYARNFAQGQGFVFYPGEKVEGFSNFLWTIFLSGTSSLGADIVRIAVITSLLFALGVVLLIKRFIRLAGSFAGVRMDLPAGEGSANASGTRDASLLIEACFVLLPAFFFPFIFYATSGLETTPTLFFLVLGALFHLEATRNHRPLFQIVSIFSFLAVSLFRPEGVLFLLINSLFLVANRHNTIREKVLLGVFPLLLYALVVWAKSTYFGGFLPNTYYAKPGASLHYLKPITRGCGYLVNFFLKSGFILLLPLALHSPKERQAAYARRYMWSFVLGQLIFIIYVGGDILRFDRFTLPFFPFLLLLSYMGAADLFQDGTTLARTIKRKTVLPILTVVVFLSIIRIPLALEKRCFHDWMHARTQKETGKILERILPERSSIVTNEVGAVAYYSKLPVIDMIGLTDKVIARIIHESYMTYGEGDSDWSVKEISDYLLSRKPECFILPSYKPLALKRDNQNKDRMHLLWYTILSNPLFADRYRPVFYVKVHASKYFYIFISKAISLKHPLPPTGRITECMSIVY